MKKDKKCYTIFTMMEIENEKGKKKNDVEERKKERERKDTGKHTAIN